MGRPACSSCCKTVSKEGCKNEDFSVYYKIGGGDWVSSSKYAQYLLDEYNAGEFLSAGFRDISKISYRISKKDYGEYQTALNCWNYPAVFLTQDLFDVIGEDAEDVLQDLINEEFQAGNEDVGLHMPTSWEIRLGEEPDSLIYIDRELVGLDTYDEYHPGWHFGFVDQPHTKPTSTPIYSFNEWENYLTDIKNMGTCPEGHWPNDDDDDTCITDIQVKVTSHLVKWCTKIYRKSNKQDDQEVMEIMYDEVDSLTWKKEYTLLNHGAEIDGIEPQEVNLLEFDGKRYTVSDDLDYGRVKDRVDRGDVLEPYTDFDYCLTYPFFSFIHYTGPFHPWPMLDIRSASVWAGGPKGTIEEQVSGDEYHADKDFFTSIDVVTKRDSVVFNPYTGSLGRSITDGEFDSYNSLFPIQKIPLIEGIKELDPGEDEETPKEEAARNDKNLAKIKENLKIQENKDLNTKDPTWHGKKVEAPYFEYTDNKIRNENDMTQYMITEDEQLGDVVPDERDFNFPIGVDIIVPPDFPKIPQTNFSNDENPREHSEDELGIWTMSTFETIMRKPEEEEDPNNIGIIFVSFRTKRGADESGILLEEGMEVYYPIGSCKKYEIIQVRNGPEQTPVSVRIRSDLGEHLVLISKIELVRDTFKYGINYRTYLLQLLYLKNLDDNSGNEYYNPFKYRVTRIDVVNSSIDHSYSVELMTRHGKRTVWNEVAAGTPKQGPAMNMEQVDIKKYKLTDTSHSDNAAYIEITREPAWDGDAGHKLFEDDCDEGKIKLEKLFPLHVPESLEDNLVVAGPAKFWFEKEKDVVLVPSQRFSHINTVHPQEESWVTHFEEDENETIVGLKKPVNFKYDQLPKSSKDDNSPYANGYFFGGWISLKFYLEEVPEWLKKLKK